MDFTFADVFTTRGILSLLTLTVMEIVLGIDNIVFISIISSKIELGKRSRARNYGLALALIPRIILLLFLSWIISLDKPLLTFSQIEVDGQPLSISWKGIIFLVGGLFLIYKSTTEIHDKLEGEDDSDPEPKLISFARAIFQIVMINAVFSFDSILTAIGLADNFYVMAIAVVIAMFIMMLFSGAVSRFINKHPTMKMLALSFLLMIGLLLVAEGFNIHIPKGYIYFAMAFSILVEMLNLRLRKKSTPVRLHKSPKFDSKTHGL